MKETKKKLPKWDNKGETKIKSSFQPPQKKKAFVCCKSRLEKKNSYAINEKKKWQRKKKERIKGKAKEEEKLKKEKEKNSLYLDGLNRWPVQILQVLLNLKLLTWTTTASVGDDGGSASTTQRDTKNQQQQAQAQHNFTYPPLPTSWIGLHYRLPIQKHATLWEFSKWVLKKTHTQWHERLSMDWNLKGHPKKPWMKDIMLYIVLYSIQFKWP